MGIFSFTLKIDGKFSDSENLANSLYEAGCDDALVSCIAGTVYIDFDREADTYQSAQETALQQIYSLGLTAVVVEEKAAAHKGGV